MQHQDPSTAAADRTARNGSQLTLPLGTECQHVAFVAATGTEASAGQTTLLEFHSPRACRAVLMKAAPASAAPPPTSTSTSAAVTESTTDLQLLMVPTPDLDDAELTAQVWNWVEPDTAPDRRQGFLIALQGARVIWSPGRAGIIAPADRLETLRLAVIDFSFHDGEVRQIERALALAWPDLEADGPLAFHFDEQAATRQPQLAQRFQQVVGWRGRLVRINPIIHRPPIHPPTLAGQLGERLKERTRVTERIDFISGQLEVFERVYELCGQRSSEFAFSRKETTLEWVIIVLLATETIILLIDLMARLGK